MTARAVERRLLSLANAADYLSVGRRTLDRLMADGQIQVVPIGARRLIDRDDLDQFIADRKAAS